jgi:hypothetical protein
MPFPKDEATPPVIKMYLVDDAIRMGGMKFCLAFLWGTKLGKLIDFPVLSGINIRWEEAEGIPRFWGFI